MALFLSTFENKVDKKGRVSVPAPFRNAVAHSHFQGIAVYRHLSLPCLEGGDISFLEQISDQLYDDSSLLDTEQLPMATAILAEANQLSFDSEGRIMLPPAAKEFTGIDDQASFVGLGRKFQIWAPAQFAMHRDEQRIVASGKINQMRPPGARGRT
jgi:MraZ protein